MIAHRRVFTFKNKRGMPRWLAWGLAIALRLYAATLRVRIVDRQGHFQAMQEGKPRVFSIWHNRILFLAQMLPKSALRHGTVLVSASRDGEYITTVLRCYGLEAVRGSSSRRGAIALRELQEKLQEGISSLLTVDGPRGPRYCVHPGAVVLGMRGGVPVVPLSVNAKHYWTLHSWDRMQIPWPFSRVVLEFGEAVPISETDAVPEATERLRKAMLSLTQDKDDEGESH